MQKNTHAVSIRRKMTPRAFIFTALLLAGAVGCSKAPKKPAYTTSQFIPGQVWTFRAPTNELPTAALTIWQVDTDPEEGPIVYISISGVRKRTWESRVMFYPYSEDALRRSVDTLMPTNAPLAGDDLQLFLQSYQILRQQVRAGKLNKCFEITVAEVLEAARKDDSKPPEN